MPRYRPGPDSPIIGHPDHLNGILRRFDPNRTLPAALFRIIPWGRNVLIVREPPVGQVGSIIVPEAAMAPQARGYVVSIGPDVGKPTGHPDRHSCPYPRPDLIGARVVFSPHVGTTIAIGDDPTLDPDTYRVRLKVQAPDLSGRLQELPRDDYQAPYKMLCDYQIMAEWLMEEETE